MPSCLFTRPNDVLLLAGDISDDLDVIRHSLATVRQAFQTVFYVPGNHELWVRGEPGDARYPPHHQSLVHGQFSQGAALSLTSDRCGCSPPLNTHACNSICCYTGFCTTVAAGHVSNCLQEWRG